MKTLSFTLILIVAAQCQLHAGNLFREVTARSDSWEVIFHEQGGRYSIEIDSIERGTSGYLQRLRLLPNESLRLVDKHWHMDIKPVDRDGKKGVEITKTYRDRFTGEQKVETTFEPNHQAEQAAPSNR
jgi:hypothetical protein